MCRWTGSPTSSGRIPPDAASPKIDLYPPVNDALISDRYFLYGPPGSGKSTIGRKLADALALPFVDLDEEIEAQAGVAIPEVFAGEGESGFRARERAALEEVLAPGRRVVALGGGALLDPESRSRVAAAGAILCLRAPEATLLARLQRAQAARPLLAGDPAARLEALLGQRAEHYDSFPVQLYTGSQGVDAAVWEAQIALGAFHVRGMGAGYDVRVAPGGLKALGEALLARELGGPIGLVTDENVGAHYAEVALRSASAAGFRTCTCTIPPGESHKTVETVGRLWESFVAGGLERGSTVVALGGGVVGDLAGFAAATYLRGVCWVVAPTSLLAMVDASLGGKTGADLPQGKNLVGAFHAPSLVLADPNTLRTLPPAELRAGLAEVVKHGVIADPELFDLCARGWETVQGQWGTVVRRAMAVKIRVIEDDPFERGLREALNLGHTIGHAVEHASDYRVRHGEAVAIGMVAEARLAERMGIAQTGLSEVVAGVLEGFALPTAIPPGLDRNRVLAAMQVDKKRRRSQTRFALPGRVGEVQVGVKVPDLDRALQAVWEERG